MKLVELQNNNYFTVPDSTRLKGIYLKRKYLENYDLVEVKKAPFFDKPFWLSPFLEVKKFDEELICHGT